MMLFNFIIIIFCQNLWYNLQIVRSISNNLSSCKRLHLEIESIFWFILCSIASSLFSIFSSGLKISFMNALLYNSIYLARIRWMHNLWHSGLLTTDLLQDVVKYSLHMIFLIYGWDSELATMNDIREGKKSTDILIRLSLSSVGYIRVYFHLPYRQQKVT